MKTQIFKKNGTYTIECSTSLFQESRLVGNGIGTPTSPRQVGTKKREQFPISSEESEGCALLKWVTPKRFIFIFTFLLLTCSLQGISYGQTLTASTPQVLTEANANTFVVTLLLEGAAWAEISKIRWAVAVSGIDAITIKTETYQSGSRWVCTSNCGGLVEWGYWEAVYSTRPVVRRKSDTVLEVPLTIDGNNFDFDTDAMLTFTVEADAIVDYNGASLTAIMPVTTTVSASAPLPLTEQNLEVSVVTLTLTGGRYAAQLLDSAVTVFGIAGVGVSDVVRKSDTVLEVPLTIDGNNFDFDTDATLAFTVAPAAIANYNSVPVTALIPVSAVKESVSASVVSPLTEATLDGSVVSLTLTGVTYEQDLSKIRGAVTVSGITGVTVNTAKVQRVNDTEITVGLNFDGTDFDIDTPLTFKVAIGGIADYTGDEVTAEISVTAVKEGVAASVVSALTEATLDGGAVSLTLTGLIYEQNLSKIRGAVSVSGIIGVTVNTAKVQRISNTEISVGLNFDDTDFDTDASLTFSVDAGAIAGYTGDAFTAEILVAAFKEVVSASPASPLTEATLHESVVTLTLTAATYEQNISKIRGAVSVSGITGVTVNTAKVQRVSDRTMTVELNFDGTDLDRDGALTFSVAAGAITNYKGTALTAEVPVTASREESLLMIFWIDRRNDKIQRANLDGSNVQDLVTQGLSQPEGIALDVAGGKMYWTDANTKKIQRANLDGSNVEDLVTQGLILPKAIALDVAGGKMYWTDSYIERIWRANLDGSNVEGLVTQGGTAPTGIALDVASGKMYWTDSRAKKIQRANLDGSNVKDLVTQGLGSPKGIALDVAGGEMYWADDDKDKIQRANLDGSNIEDLVTGLAGPIGIALDIAGGKMYWTDEGRDKIQRANLDGSNVEDLVKGLWPSIGIAIGLTSQSTPTTVKEDVNRDGVVDVQDLAYVGLQYGKTGTNAADVNGDNIVNVDDLIAVAAAVDAAAAAAPAARVQVQSHFTAAQLQGWLTEARASRNTAFTYQRGIAVIERLLALIAPEETALLANYPNPFNPETWIPYHLANDSDVLLSIYDINGALVRELDLGHQRAGYYTDRGRAAYWDGRNGLGEQVASGVYFYQLRAGDYAATRKMLILK